MKLIEMNDTNGHQILINPDRIVYVEDLSSYGRRASRIDLGTEVVHVPYPVRTVYEMIREETDPKYISYEHMTELIELERKYRDEQPGNSGANG